MRWMRFCFVGAGPGFHPLYGSATRKRRKYLLLLRNVHNTKQIFCMNHCLDPPVLNTVFIQVPKYLICPVALALSMLSCREGQLLTFCKQQKLRNRETEVPVCKMHLRTATAPWHRTSLLGTWLLCKFFLSRFEYALPAVTQGASAGRQNRGLPNPSL